MGENVRAKQQGRGSRKLTIPLPSLTSLVMIFCLNRTVSMPVLAPPPPPAAPISVDLLTSCLAFLENRARCTCESTGCNSARKRALISPNQQRAQAFKASALTEQEYIRGSNSGGVVGAEKDEKVGHASDWGLSFVSSPQSSTRAHTQRISTRRG